MANKDNKLSHLKVDKKHYPDMELLFNTQRKLQKYLAETKGRDSMDITQPEKYSLRQLSDWMLRNKHALDDEFSEMMDALGGIDDGVGSVAWKWWKEGHFKKDGIESLSDNDIKELKMEYVDMLHFFINMGILLGMNGSEVMNMYMAKNKENIKRQEDGY